MSRIAGTGRKHDYDSVLRFITNFKQDNDGVSPSMREISRFIGSAHGATVKHILNVLAKEGKIRISGRFRSIEVVGGRWMPPNP